WGLVLRHQVTPRAVGPPAQELLRESAIHRGAILVNRAHDGNARGEPVDKIARRVGAETVFGGDPERRVFDARRFARQAIGAGGIQHMDVHPEHALGARWVGELVDFTERLVPNPTGSQGNSLKGVTAHKAAALLFQYANGESVLKLRYSATLLINRQIVGFWLRHPEGKADPWI